VIEYIEELPRIVKPIYGVIKLLCDTTLLHEALEHILLQQFLYILLDLLEGSE